MTPAPQGKYFLSFVLAFYLPFLPFRTQGKYFHSFVFSFLLAFTGFLH